MNKKALASCGLCLGPEHLRSDNSAGRHHNVTYFLSGPGAQGHGVHRSSVTSELPMILSKDGDCETITRLQQRLVKTEDPMKHGPLITAVSRSSMVPRVFAPLICAAQLPKQNPSPNSLGSSTCAIVFAY
jgi:hypothetical protein